MMLQNELPHIDLKSYSNVYNDYPPSLKTNAIGTPRVNPLRQGVIRSHMLETEGPHLINYRRAEEMKQREYSRYHNAWGKFYYGTPREQETQRAHSRNVLKQQMKDLDMRKKIYQTEKCRESANAMDRDSAAMMEDRVHQQNRYHHLKLFRDENKRLMEDSWTKTKTKRELDINREITCLRHNPINWSGTLK